MPEILNQKLLPYEINKLYSIITDVERYPEFIPWFKKIKITSTDNHIIVTDVTVEFMFVRERYTSSTELTPIHSVDGEIIANAVVTMINGPFHHFITIWSLREIDSSMCFVEFKCDFSFNNKMYDKIAVVALKSMNKKIMENFIKRAALSQ